MARPLVVGVVVATLASAHPLSQTRDPELPAQDVRAIHSRAFTSVTPGAIPAAIKRRSTGNVIIKDVEPDFDYFVDPDPGRQMQILGCAPGSAVIVGTTTAGQAYLTADEGNIYTEWTFRVSQVLRGPLTPATGLTVLHKGGQLRLNGRLVKSVREKYKPLEADKEYLLVIERRIPETGGSVTGPVGFDLTTNPVTPLSDYPSVALNQMSRNSLLAIAAAAVGMCK